MKHLSHTISKIPTKLKYSSSNKHHINHILGFTCAFLFLLLPEYSAAQSVPTVTCSTDPAIFNTGINGINGYSVNSPKLPIPSLDEHWSIASAFSDIFTSTEASALNYAVGPVDRPGAGNTAWVQSPFGNAEWIGVQYGRDYYVYRYEFNLDASVDPSSFNLSLNLYVDNQVKRVLINDGAIFDYTNNGVITGVGGFSAGGNVPILLNNGWKTGSNIIYVVVWNQGDPSGLLVQSSGTASCSPPLNVSKQAVTASGAAYTGLAVANAPIYYDITVTNASTKDASGTLLKDTIPLGLESSGSTWTCTRPIGSSAICPTPSTGAFPLNATLPTLPAGSSLKFRIASKFSNPLPASATVITNTATIEPSPASGLTCDGREGFPTPCTSSASIATSPLVSVTKTAASQGPLYPGQNAIYSVIVKNEGAAELTNVVLTDVLPLGFSSGTWTCQSPIGSQAICPQNSGALLAGGSINQTIPSMRANSSLIYTITGIVDEITEQANNVINTATIAAGNSTWICFDPLTGQTKVKPCSSSAPVNLWPNPMVQLSKTAAMTAPLFSGQQISYTVTARNLGKVPVTGVHIIDPIPTGLENMSWTCTGNGSATCTIPSGAGPLDMIVPTMEAGDSLVYILTATASALPPTTIINLASLDVAEKNARCIGAPNTGALPCNAQHEIATSVLSILEISKVVNGNVIVHAGDALTYTITVKNAGSVSATQVLLSDIAPANIIFGSWTCQGSNITCPTSSGSGSISELIPLMTPNSSLTYVLNATVNTRTPEASTIVNQAVVKSEINNTVCQSGGVQPCAASAAIVIRSSRELNISPVPSLSQFALAFLSAMAAALGMHFISRNRNR